MEPKMEWKYNNKHDIDGFDSVKFHIPKSKDYNYFFNTFPTLYDSSLPKKNRAVYIGAFFRASELLIVKDTCVLVHM